MKLSRRIFGFGMLGAVLSPLPTLAQKQGSRRIIVQNHDGEIMAEVQPGNGKTVVWRVGSDDRPATPDDIADFQKCLVAVRDDPSLMIVTHHLISATVI